MTTANLTDNDAVMTVQRMLYAQGLYDGLIDGKWGNATNAAFDAYNAQYEQCRAAKDIPKTVRVSVPTNKIVWSAKVSNDFIKRVIWIADAFGWGNDLIDGLMTVIAFESGETFSPSVRNMAGSEATGLIQFMPTTAQSLGTSTLELMNMSAEDQLNYVYKYLKPNAKRIKNIGDLYMAILWPKAIGVPDSTVLWDKAKLPIAYRQNSGLDINRDSVITRGEALAKIMAKLERGKLFIK